MRRMTTALAVALVLTTGCGGGDDEDDQAARPSPAETAAPPAEAGDERVEALKVAGQGYSTALFKGQIAGIVGYFDPEVCDEADNGSAALAAGAISEAADGATMTITEVEVDGDRGRLTGYKLSDDASDGLRRLAKSAIEENPDDYPWVYRNGEWYLSGPCEDETASPSPSA